MTKKRADDGRDEADGANGQRVDHQGVEFWQAIKEDCCQDHGCDDGHCIGFKEVSGHAGAVADIVADVVCDRCRVPRVIFGDTCFDLTDEVAANVGPLREDAATETGKDRYERSTEPEGDECVDDGPGGRLVFEDDGEDVVVDRNAQEREAGNEHPCDRTRFERDIKTSGKRLGCSLSRSHVGTDRDPHADVAGNA